MALPPSQLSTVRTEKKASGNKQTAEKIESEQTSRVPLLVCTSVYAHRQWKRRGGEEQHVQQRWRWTVPCHSRRSRTTQISQKPRKKKKMEKVESMCAIEMGTPTHTCTGCHPANRGEVERRSMCCPTHAEGTVANAISVLLSTISWRICIPHSARATSAVMRPA